MITSVKEEIVWRLRSGDTAEEVCLGYCGSDEYHKKHCPVAKRLRDEWVSPEWLTEVLPAVDLDPCSNERSTVKAKRHLRQWDRDEDGLAVSWEGLSVYINGPFSNLLPWAKKTAEALAFIFLANLDPSTTWFKTLTRNHGYALFLFDRRLKFKPPPRIRESTNSKAQCLVCNQAGFELFNGNAIYNYGNWWTLL